MTEQFDIKKFHQDTYDAIRAWEQLACLCEYQQERIIKLEKEIVMIIEERDRALVALQESREANNLLRMIQLVHVKES